MSAHAPKRTDATGIIEEHIERERLSSPLSSPPAPRTTPAMPTRSCAQSPKGRHEPHYEHGAIVFTSPSRMDAQCQHCSAAIYRRSDSSSWWHAAPAASLSGTPAPTTREHMSWCASGIESVAVCNCRLPAPTDRVQEIEAAMQEMEKAAVRFELLADRFRGCGEQNHPVSIIEAGGFAESSRDAFARVAARLSSLEAERDALLRSLEADAREMKTRVEALPRWGLVHRVGEAPDLDITPRGSLLDRGSVLHLLAAHPLEAPANGQ